jgi:hypothetical protein
MNNVHSFYQRNYYLLDIAPIFIHLLDMCPLLQHLFQYYKPHDIYQPRIGFVWIDFSLYWVCFLFHFECRH